MTTAVPSRTHEEAAPAVCTEAELKQSQKRTALLQLRISAGELFHSLQAQLSTLTTAALCEAKEAFCSIVGSSKPVAYLYTHRKLFSRLGAIVSLGTAAIVAIATIRLTPERPSVTAVTAVSTQTEITQAAKAETETAIASKAITNPENPTESLIGPFGFSLGSADQSVPTRPLISTEQQSIPAPPLIKENEPLAAPKPESIPSPAQAAVAEVPEPSPEPTAVRKEFVEIAVELKIQDGRIVEAHVASRQPGAEAFEATALYIARQRRYPPGTSRTETVVLRVANRLGRKEP